MKRYLLFAGQFYYPAGGWRDFRFSYDTLANAVADGERLVADAGMRSPDWWHVIDRNTGEIVARNEADRSEHKP